MCATGGGTLRAVGELRADPIERQVIAALEALGEPFEVMDCDPAFADTANFCERYGVDPAISANAIIVASKKEPKQYAACVVLATTKLDVNGVVRKKLGVNKASFASPDETRELTGMMIGGVTPFALPEHVPLWIDRRVMDHDDVVVGGGSRAMKVRVASAVFKKLANAEIVDDLAKEL